MLPALALGGRAQGNGRGRRGSISERGDLVGKGEQAHRCAWLARTEGAATDQGGEVRERMFHVCSMKRVARCRKMVFASRELRCRDQRQPRFAGGEFGGGGFLALAAGAEIRIVRGPAAGAVIVDAGVVPAAGAAAAELRHRQVDERDRIVERAARRGGPGVVKCDKLRIDLRIERKGVAEEFGLVGGEGQLVVLGHGEAECDARLGLVIGAGGAGLRAVRSGDWKLHIGGGNKKQQKEGIKPVLTLYNLADDIGETTDVAAANQKIVQRLYKRALAFDKSLKADARPAGEVKTAG